MLATLLGPVAFRLSLRVPLRGGTGALGTGARARASSSVELRPAATGPAAGAAVPKADGALQGDSKCGA